MDSLLALARDPAAWAALATLVAMEVVLGIDNLIFISILTNKLPEAMREKARRLGISLALVMRLGLLATIAWIVALTEPVFTLLGKGISWRDIILIAGVRSWSGRPRARSISTSRPSPGMARRGMVARAAPSFAVAIGQILVLDLVFSIDSIITAVGMTDHVPIMFVAVIAAVTVMLFAATPLANFINANPTIIMLALAFLIMIGMTLIADGLGHHVPKGYIYVAMAFSTGVEG